VAARPRCPTHVDHARVCDGAEVPPNSRQSSQTSDVAETGVDQRAGEPVTFALIMHDPDVARERKTEDMLHWVVFNIPARRATCPKDVPGGPAPGHRRGAAQERRRNRRLSRSGRSARKARIITTRGNCSRSTRSSI